jgi:Zn finger protein HypA/HybF involved in hydrogenase expression
MQSTALVLVSCTQCQRLHEPHVVDVSHPICPSCAQAERAASQRRAKSIGLALE